MGFCEELREVIDDSFVSGVLATDGTSSKDLQVRSKSMRRKYTTYVLPVCNEALFAKFETSISCAMILLMMTWHRRLHTVANDKYFLR